MGSIKKIPIVIRFMVTEQFMKVFQNCAFCSIAQFWNVFMNCSVTVILINTGMFFLLFTASVRSRTPGPPAVPGVFSPKKHFTSLLFSLVHQYQLYHPVISLTPYSYCEINKKMADVYILWVDTKIKDKNRKNLLMKLLNYYHYPRCDSTAVFEITGR